MNNAEKAAAIGLSILAESDSLAVIAMKILVLFDSVTGDLSCLFAAAFS